MGPEEIPAIERNTTWEISDAEDDDTYVDSNNSGNDDNSSSSNEGDPNAQEG